MIIKLAEETGIVVPESFKVVVADTTVMPKPLRIQPIPSTTDGLSCQERGH